MGDTMGDKGDKQGTVMRAGIPVLRILSTEQAHEFYLGFLGFSVDWEHHFEPGLPLYSQISRSGLVLHLSEHRGDGTPGAVVWAAVDDVSALRTELSQKRYSGTLADIDAGAPGGPTLELTDPFGNVLRFCQPA
ncbi:glyoxalase superfamily protein [Salinibacterium sp. ZJ454]|uniref:glyoxalase superfamily protein n=1 Tax=Salinibacterium sp. ZJ454 TaxID=2708339 RepID=UPI001FB8A4E4|nr:glyoxalase superfamily protein [Salinibacterium sp. ZJ454]